MIAPVESIAATIRVPNPRVGEPQAAPPIAPLEDVLATHRLAERMTRPPNHAAEARALHAISRALTVSAQAALDALTFQALSLWRPRGNGTTGVSLVEHDTASNSDVFRWTSMAGRLAHRVGGTTPRAFSPCGVCLDRMEPVLFDRPDRRFHYFAGAGAPFVEGLVIPFIARGTAAGTIWIVSHGDARVFDLEDVRIMARLAEFAGTVYSTFDRSAAAA